jgi:phosphoribosylaminoimidazole-succinocarboxamide synthase
LGRIFEGAGLISKDTIIAAIPQAMETVELPELGPKQNGKVRDFYSYNGKRVTITTDRQSAFDQMLGHVPFKGSVLNLLAAWWFEQTKQIVPNHLIAVPDPNVLVSHECQAIPVEMIVRGYMSGVTKTSIWYSYQQGERHIYGLDFPDGLVKNQRLPSPAITPTTHGGGTDGHDERLTRDEIIDRGIVERELYEQMERASLALFEFGSRRAKEQGLILVDTKYEFGLYEDKLMLIDEVHTPDSSRFWKADSYDERMRAGQEPDNFDKEFIRLAYAAKGYRGDGPAEPMSQDLIVQAAQRYIGVYEILTGQTFEPYEYPIEQQIQESIRSFIDGNG